MGPHERSNINDLMEEWKQTKTETVGESIGICGGLSSSLVKSRKAENRVKSNVQPKTEACVGKKKKPKTKWFSGVIIKNKLTRVIYHERELVIEPIHGYYASLKQTTK